MKFVPLDKQSKRQRDEHFRSRRKAWDTDPRPRIVESKKKYNRKRKEREE